MCLTAPGVLSREEIDVLEDTVRVLGPIEFVTTEISGDSYPTSSLVIPLIHCMEGTIKNCVALTIEGNKFRDNILFEVQRRFKAIESNKILAVSTILDPRYKRIHFQSLRAVSDALSYINRQLKIIATNNNEEVNRIDHLEQRTRNKVNEFDVWAFHYNLVESRALSVDDSDGMSLELRQYLNQSLISRSQNPFEHWQTLKSAYPTLFPIAMRYLSVVATSVPSELVFSKTGIIKSDLRSRLTGKRLNNLLFLGLLSEENWGFD